MVQTIFAKDISLYELEEQFGLQLIDDPCFTEWTSNSITVTEQELQALNRLRSNYLNLVKRRFMSEEAVKMVVLSPLLDLAEFYQPPFASEGEQGTGNREQGRLCNGALNPPPTPSTNWWGTPTHAIVESKSGNGELRSSVPRSLFPVPFLVETETSIKISAEYEGVIVKGNIDVLVVQRQLWILVIESKATKFDVMTALPQALAYMLDDTTTEQPTFGLLLNGREFVFVKLTHQDIPQYSLSKAFSILTPEDDLYQVLHLLKHIGALVSQ